MRTPFHTSRGTRAVVLALGAALAVAGCSAPSAGPTGGTTGAGGTSMLVAADNGSPTFERNFNPFSPSKRNGVNFMYEPLTVLNTLDGTETPFLATGYEQPDARTIVFTIRDGVKWSDGQDFTPNDVLYTFNLMKAQPTLDSRGIWQHIDTVTVDGQKVIVALKGDDAPAAGIISQQVIVPEHVWSQVDDPTTFTNEDPVVTGPYLLGDFTPNQYTLVKNTDYWQADKVAVDSLVLPAANTQLDVVNNGYDWAYAFMSDVEGTWVAADPQHNTYWFPAGGIISLFPNLTKAPFNDVNFRQGLSVALDRNRIADVAEEGYVDAAGISGLMLPNQRDWLNPDLPDGGAVTQDTNKALTYFEKAGYTKSGDKLVDSSGTPLEVTLTTANGWTDWLRGVQEVQRQLGALGITVNLNQPQPAAYTSAMNNGDFDLIMGAFGGTGSLYQDFHALLSGEELRPVGTAAAANFERFSDPKVDALLSQLKGTVDQDAQRQIGYQLQQTMVDQMPVVPMFYGGLWGLFSSKNFTGWPSQDNAYASPVTWSSNVLVILTNLKPAKS